MFATDCYDISGHFKIVKLIWIFVWWLLLMDVWLFWRYLHCLWIDLVVFLRFCHLEIEKRSQFWLLQEWKSPVSVILSDFRELAFCEPCGPCLTSFKVFRVLIWVPFKLKIILGQNIPLLSLSPTPSFHFWMEGSHPSKE